MEKKILWVAVLIGLLSCNSGKLEGSEQPPFETVPEIDSSLINNVLVDSSWHVFPPFDEVNDPNLDTTEIAMRIFANADLLYYQQKYDDAIIKYNSVLTRFTGHSLSDEIYMRIGSIYLKNGKIEEALANYKRIEENWSYDILADDAIYKRAKIYDDILKNPLLAMKLYEQILLEHNSSIYVAESRKRFRYLRGDNLKK